MSWIRRLLGLCEHDFKYIKSIEVTKEEKCIRINSVTNERIPYHDKSKKIVRIYFCNKCGKEKHGVIENV